MNPLRVAVIGAGHLGSIHARLLKTQDSAVLVGIVDPLAAAREKVAAECDTPAFANHDEVVDRIDAAVIATPTKYHHAVGMDLLRRGVHLFIEKPITTTLDEADQLLAAAQANGLTVQVGHVERFNPALTAAAKYVEPPRYIQAVRASGYSFRSTDVGVVLDLMIHDLDVVLSLVDSPLVRVEAIASAVIGPHEDQAQARLTFANGALADLSASRVSPTAHRKMRVYGGQGFTEIDFATRSARTLRPSERVLRGELDVERLSTAEIEHLKENLFSELLPLVEHEVEEGNAIALEQADFLDSIRHQRSPRVDGRQGRDALAVAQLILQQVADRRGEGGSAGSHIRFPAGDPASTKTPTTNDGLRKAS